MVRATSKLASSARLTLPNDERPRFDSLTAELFGRYVPKRLGELPSMAGEILQRAVSLAVLAVCRRFEHASPVNPSSLELGIDVVHAHPDEMAHDPALWGLLLTPDIGDDQSAIFADAELGPVALSYARSLDEAESLR